MISRLGQKHNRLLILGQWIVGRGVRGSKSYALAQCDCGNLKEYQLHKVTSGWTKSCGCLQRERTSECSRTHEMSQTKVYRVWTAMIQRCTNPKDLAFKNYGARGIKVCDRWLKFENFYRDMGDRPSNNSQIDRIDNNKGYSKENCRWATAEVNVGNRRVSKYWFLFGKKYGSISEAAKALGVVPATVCNWCNGQSQVRKGVRYEYPPKDGCYSELKYKDV